MGLTPSKMLPLGSPAPEFSLVDTLSGKRVALGDSKAKKGLVLMFICNHCPYVKHIQDGLVALGKDYEKKDVALIAVNANDAASYPEDAPEKMAEVAKAKGYRFPYLYDETQDVARAYQAACTPDFFVYDSARKLVYRGQFDGSRPGNGIPVTGQDLRAAIDLVLAGKTVPAYQKPSVGCNIKWR
jgi:thiol-disulfide isomerase/thioredoxin